MRPLRIGTRGSLLAMTQARTVAAAIEAADPKTAVELVEIRTRGDRLRDVPLTPDLGQAFFTREIEDALSSGRIDLAVHSCKDLGTTLPEGLCIAGVPRREDPRDALVTRGPLLGELPEGARVGTSSPRRRGFLAGERPDLEAVDLRGNVPTRVDAVDGGRIDAAILAVAGLKRLGLEGRITEALDVERLVPSAGQGALALQVREDDERARALAEQVTDGDALAEVTAERACLRRLGAGCQSPVGAVARARGGDIRLLAGVYGPGGLEWTSGSGPAATAAGIGEWVAEALLSTLGVATLQGALLAGGSPVEGRAW